MQKAEALPKIEEELANRVAALNEVRYTFYRKSSINPLRVACSIFEALEEKLIKAYNFYFKRVLCRNTSLSSMKS